MIKSIQIARFFAAFGVVIAHLSPFGLKVGGFGVDIFFVISGFIISHVSYSNHDYFLLKRIIRVVPLYFIATFILILVTIKYNHLINNVIVSKEAILKSLLFIPYRIENSGPILSLGWTLNNEMLFYLLCSIGLFIKKTTHIKSVDFNIIIVTLFYVTIQFTSPENFPFTFFKEGLMPEFIMGIILYHFWKSKYFNVSNINVISIIIGASSIIFLILADLYDNLKFLDRNIWRGLPAFFLLNGILHLEQNIKNSKAIRVLLNLGNSSYALYLFHPFIIYGYTRIMVPILNLNVYFLEIPALLILLFYISSLIHERVEIPITSFLRHRIIPKNDR